jgi:predicted metal-dependent hydrolase
MTSLQVRRVQFDFDDDVPFAWQPDHPEFAVLMNTISLMIIGFEKVIVDAVRDAIPRITDPAVIAEADAFLRQEAQHARAHRTHVKALYRSHPGLQPIVDGVQAEFEAHFALKPLEYRLAYIADLEATFTPTFKQWLDHADELFGPGDERVASLFLWHFTEEIEHRSSALIIYQAVVGRPWYRLVQLPSVLRHMGKVMRFTTDGINESVPIEVRKVDARNLLPGRQIRRQLAARVPILAGDLDLSHPGIDAFIPRREVRQANLRLLRSQSPHHDPGHQPLPAFADEWIARYDGGADVSHWYSSGEAH